MKLYNTSCQSLTKKPCLASNVQQWEGGRKYLGIEFLLTTSTRQQVVLTHCRYIKVSKSWCWLQAVALIKRLVQIGTSSFILENVA